eukprot:SAG11_NODE_770_length_7257_cov_2.448449_4_plen_78_part_00
MSVRWIFTCLSCEPCVSANFTPRRTHSAARVVRLETWRTRPSKEAREILSERRPGTLMLDMGDGKKPMEISVRGERR